MKRLSLSLLLSLWGGGAIQPYFTRVLAEEAGFSLEPRAIPQAAGLSAVGKLAAT